MGVFIEEIFFECFLAALRDFFYTFAAIMSQETNEKRLRNGKPFLAKSKK
jgi:hypothetical protein